MKRVTRTHLFLLLLLLGLLLGLAFLLLCLLLCIGRAVHTALVALLGIARLLLFLANALDARVDGERGIHDSAQTSRVLFLTPRALRLVLFFCVSLVIAAASPRM